FLMAVAVPKNAPKPDISSPAAVKQAFLAAKTIGFVDPDFGSAGQGASEAIMKLGITDQIATKIKVPNGGGPCNADLLRVSSTSACSISATCSRTRTSRLL